jgi:hypothetical protein
MFITNWFTGVVENINDPLNAGRVQVRCFEYHSQDTQLIPSKDLPWALPILPVTSASLNGIGSSATGLKVGSWVFGFFRDEDLQDLVVLGSIPGVTDNGGFFSLPRSAGTATGATSSGYGSAITSSQTAGYIPNAQAPNMSSLQDSSPIQVSGDVATRLISVAKNEIGVVETSKDRGPGIEKYWTATSSGSSGYGQAWCAAFVCWVIRQSGVLPETALPKNANAFGFANWARTAGRSFTQLRSSPREIFPGDIVMFNWSHVGIATTRSVNGAFKSVDGNTGAGGVFERNRTLSSVKDAVTIKGNS